MREGRTPPSTTRHPGEGRDPRTPRSEILDPGLRRDDDVSKEVCNHTNPFGLSLSKLSPCFSAGQIRDKESGFTLVELMVALVIFAMLSAAGVALLSFSVRAQAAANERLDEVATLRRLNALLTADLAQAIPRPFRDAAGANQPAFTGNGTTSGGVVALGMVRTGWSNPDAAPRASVQRVEYRLAADRLERVAWPHVDGAEPLPPATLLTGVRSLRVRYRTRGEWRDRWDTDDPRALPQAVEVAADVDRLGAVRQLFIVGTDNGLAPAPGASVAPGAVVSPGPGA